MRRLFLVCLVFLLAGCGSGGESPPEVSAPLTPETPTAEPIINVPQAFASFVHTGYDLPVTITTARFVFVPGEPPSEIVGYDTSTGRASASPGVASSFCRTGQVPPCPETWRVIETQTGTRGSQVEYAQGSYTIVMTKLANPFEFAPGVFQENFVVYDPHTYPETVKAGDTGDLRRGTQWDQEAGYRRVPPRDTSGFVTVRYSVASDSPSSLLVTFTEQNRSENDNEQEFISIYRVDTEEHVTPVSLSVRLHIGSQVTYSLVVMTF